MADALYGQDLRGGFRFGRNNLGGAFFPRQLALILTLIFAFVRFSFFFLLRFIDSDLFRCSHILWCEGLTTISGSSALILAIILPPFYLRCQLYLPPLFRFGLNRDFKVADKVEINIYLLFGVPAPFFATFMDYDPLYKFVEHWHGQL